MKSIRSSWK